MTEKGKIGYPRYREQSIVPPFHAEIDGGARRMSFLLSGVNSIRDFSSSAVLLRCKGVLVEIKGESLSLAVYENKTVEIIGKIYGMELSYDKM